MKGAVEIGTMGDEKVVFTEPTVSLRRQWLQLKARYPETIMLFRLGDFVEAIQEDADVVAAALDLVTVTRKDGDRPIRVAGFPFVASEANVTTLVEAGHKVAICERH